MTNSNSSYMDWAFWFYWIMATTIGWMIGIMFFNGIPVVVSGVAISVLQGVVLYNRIHKAWRWAIFSSLSWIAGYIASVIFFSSDTQVLVGPIIGLIVGITQWVLLRNEFNWAGWGQTDMGWGINPAGMLGELIYLKENHDNPKIYITENGCAIPDAPDDKGFVKDWDRIRFLNSHLQSVHEAIQKGVNIQGYVVWSILDNFEWERGYGPRFGLVRVDYDTLERIPKQSAYWYGEVIKNNSISI